MKYKVGDKVWIREDIEFGFKDQFSNVYRIQAGEIDIRGMLVKIKSLNGSNGYNCSGYESFYDSMIDHSKTTPHIDIEPNIQYEIY